jgi:hypothetical protein
LDGEASRVRLHPCLLTGFKIMTVAIVIPVDQEVRGNRAESIAVAELVCDVVP